MTRWDGFESARYWEMIELEMLKGCRWLALLAVTLFPAFSFLDYYSHRHLFTELSLVRFSTVVICLLGYLFIRNKKKFRCTFIYSILLVWVATFSVTLMCILQGGFKSPYYAGVGLVILATVVIMPIGPNKLFPIIMAQIAIYLFGIILGAGFAVEDTEAFINNFFFLFSNGVIGMTASHLKEGMRRESFERYLEIEKAQIDLQRSRDMLQVELKSEQGNVETLVRDLRDRKVELENALNLRDEFISLASHELNTPLTALKLQTQMARRKVSDNPLLQQEVDKILGTYEFQLQRLIRIVNDMLDITRIASGRLELERTSVDLVKTVQNVVDLMPVQEVDIRIRTNTAYLVGHWDNFKIEQLILNLLTNAIKYGNQKPVEILLYKNDNRAFMEVIDQGIGISPENQQRIFERFERAVLSREFSGLGLGLYITKQIVLAHEGNISLQSEPGKGSVFKIELPMT